jgi:hypothetical protein
VNCCDLTSTTLTYTQEKARQAAADDRSQTHDVWLAPKITGTLGSAHKLGLVPHDDIDAFVRERWGAASPASTRCTLPITEGKYWPLNNSVWE